MQLKSPGEAGRLPHTELLPFSTTPGGGRGCAAWRGKGGQGKDGGLGVVSESRMVILLPSGFGYKTIYISNVLKVEFECNHIWNQDLVSLICKFVQMTRKFKKVSSTLAFIFKGKRGWLQQLCSVRQGQKGSHLFLLQGLCLISEEPR